MLVAVVRVSPEASSALVTSTACNITSAAQTSRLVALLVIHLLLMLFLHIYTYSFAILTQIVFPEKILLLLSSVCKSLYNSMIFVGSRHTAARQFFEIIRSIREILIG